MENKVSFKRSLDTTGLPIVKVKFKNVYLCMLVDTGANWNYICSDLVKYLNNKDMMDIERDLDLEITGACGNMQTNSFVNMNFNINDKEFEAKFVCTDMTGPQSVTLNTGFEIMGIIGSNFLRENCISLNYKDCNLEL